MDLDRWLEQAATKNGFASPYQRGDVDDVGKISPDQRDVDITDFNTVAQNFDPLGFPGSELVGNWESGNFDGDGDIDITDFNLVAANFTPLGYGADGPLGNTPEPTSCVLLSMAGLLILIHRSRSAKNSRRPAKM